MLGSQDVFAVPITIVNPSFEDQVLADLAWTPGIITGWNVFDGNTGAFNPSVGQYNPDYDGNGADPTKDENVAYSNNGSFCQDLSDTLQLNTRYTLSVDVGDRLDTNIIGYEIHLRAFDGGGQTTLAGLDSTGVNFLAPPLPPNGGFVTNTLVYDTGAAHPRAGDQLRICFISDGTQTNFDHVALDAEPLSSTGFVIDFETFSHGQVINNQMAAQIPNGPTGLGVVIYGDNYFIPPGGPNTNDPMAPPVYPTLANIDLNDLAVAFDSNTQLTVEDTDLLAGTLGFTTDFPIQANRNILPLPPVPPNSPAGNFPGIVLIIEDDMDLSNRCQPQGGPNPPTNCEDPASMDPLADDEGDRPAGQFIFVFSKPVVLKSLDVFDIDADENDPTDILFYDSSNALIGQSQVLTVDGDPNNPPTGDNKWRQIDLNAVGVKTMVIELAGSGAIDNIVYDLPVGGAVLDTDNVSLMVLGLQSSFVWLAPLVLAGTGAALYKLRKN